LGFEAPYPHASTPVPPHDAVDVKPDADLMFLGGYKAEAHIVYFGESRDSLNRVAELTDTNLYSPPNSVAGQTYFWRVDAVNDDGVVVTGPVWKFTVQ
jgi:hypothetical protein